MKIGRLIAARPVSACISGLLGGHRPPNNGTVFVVQPGNGQLRGQVFGQIVGHGLGSSPERRHAGIRRLRRGLRAHVDVTLPAEDLPVLRGALLVVCPMTVPAPKPTVEYVRPRESLKIYFKNK